MRYLGRRGKTLRLFMGMKSRQLDLYYMAVNDIKYY